MEPIRILHNERSEFRVLLLGPLEVYRDGRQLDVERRQRSAGTLLKLLATAPGWRRAQEELIEVLWPNATPAVGPANLRTTIHTLRQSLGAGEPSPIGCTRGWVFLNPAHTWRIDADQLAGILATRSATPEALTRALDLFRDDPLPENRYDDWAARVRNRLHRMHRDASLRLISACTENAELERAREHAELLLDEDPLDEEAEHRLLIVLAALDLRVEALRRYNDFVQRLQSEMGVAPDRRLQALAQTLRADLNSVGAD